MFFHTTLEAVKSANILILIKFVCSDRKLKNIILITNFLEKFEGKHLYRACFSENINVSTT